MTAARILRIKAAQNQLIALCGGIDDAVEALGGNYGRSTVGRWNDLGDSTLMPLGAVMALEGACAQPIVTAAMAEINGRRLAEPDMATRRQADFLTQNAETITQIGELMRASAQAIADGKITPNEATSIDRAAGDLEGALANYRQALAGIRAGGGLSVAGSRA